jgi:hypothetical protein
MNPSLHITTIKKSITPYVGSHLEPFSFVKEGFNGSQYIDVDCSNTTDPVGCIQRILNYETTPIDTAVTNYTYKLNHLNHQITDLSKNIADFNAVQNPMLNPDSNTNRYYDYIGSVWNTPPTLQDGMMFDNYDMALRENTLYIAGTMAMSVLLIAAIMLASDKSG